jgi:LSD1 subclass zinc finger protein
LEQSDLQPTRPETSFIRTFPCTGCGAKLSFAPGTSSLKCEFCGTANEIAENDARIEELDLATFFRALEGKQEMVEDENVRCEKCGAEQNLPASHFAATCTFCGTPIVSKGYANRHIKPRSLVPFQLDRPRAQESFRRWIRGRWMAPRDLKRYAQTDAGLNGVYLPFWTFDCQTASDYTGQRGVRRDKSTSWTSVSGHIGRFHDDVVVLASTSLPETLLDRISHWDTTALVPYQPEFVSGFRAEAYRIGLKDGWPIGKGMIDAEIRRLIRKDIGGDEQKIDSVRTQYSDVTFKHVLLPVWISAYRYRDKVYRFLINGQTGEVAGESPMSWQKVTLLVIGIIVVVLLALVFGSN